MMMMMCSTENAAEIWAMLNTPDEVELWTLVVLMDFSGGDELQCRVKR